MTSSISQIFNAQEEVSSTFELDSGSSVAVIGGGPAGSFFSFYLLDLAQRMGLELDLDIYEPRDFSRPAPIGCNMCGGIISESLVQNLAADGINLSPNVVQRGIDSYILHTDVGDVKIQTPLQEKRIGAVTRGSGPRDVKEIKWDSFDGNLQNRAIKKGANVIRERVSGVEIVRGKPKITTRKGKAQTYDLLVVAVGVNSPTMKLFEKLDFGYQPPETTKTFICEYYFGKKIINQFFGNSMHVFLLNIPRLEFAAIIPKGDYTTVCMLGEDIDESLVETFLNTPEVKASMPPGWEPQKRSCNCLPRINIEGCTQPFTDRIVFIGDCGITRLYKDGIGAAYRTAKAAASTAILQGVSAEAFQKYYLPACQAIKTDNAIGKITFLVTEQIQKYRFARQGLVHMTQVEQENAGMQKNMSMVMWDMFTGSAPYRDILLRTLHPVFIGRFLWSILISIAKPHKKP